MKFIWAKYYALIEVACSFRCLPSVNMFPFETSLVNQILNQNFLTQVSSHHIHSTPDMYAIYHVPIKVVHDLYAPYLDS